MAQYNRGQTIIDRSVVAWFVVVIWLNVIGQTIIGVTSDGRQVSGSLVCCCYMAQYNRGQTIIDRSVVAWFVVVIWLNVIGQTIIGVTSDGRQVSGSLVCCYYMAQYNRGRPS